MLYFVLFDSCYSVLLVWSYDCMLTLLYTSACWPMLLCCCVFFIIYKLDVNFLLAVFLLKVLIFCFFYSTSSILLNFFTCCFLSFGLLHDSYFLYKLLF